MCVDIIGHTAKKGELIGNYRCREKAEELKDDNFEYEWLPIVF